MTAMKKTSVATEEKARVQFDFSRESLEKLDEIVSTVNASTRAELIRRALTLYTEVLEANKRGAKIFFRESDGTVVQLMPLF
jgi:metal-responsive CopG/Arc/MetJ family transcriptional regulator